MTVSVEPSFDFFHDDPSHFQEFANFLESVGLPAGWTPPGLGHQVEASQNLQVSRERESPNSPRLISDESRSGSPFGSWLPSVPQDDQTLGSVSDKGMPSLFLGRISPQTCTACNISPYTKSDWLLTVTEFTDPRDPDPKNLAFRVSPDVQARFSASLEEFRDVVPDFILPSRHTLTRYIISFFEGFHSHLRFLHVPTLRLADRPLELILAMCAAGAQYCFEHRNAARLFHAAKAILMAKMVGRMPDFGWSIKPALTLPTNACEGPPHISRSVPGATLPPGSESRDSESHDALEAIRCLLTLMGYATWEGSELLHEAFSLRSLLIQRLRDVGLYEEVEDEPTNTNLCWSDWADQESTRRIKLVSFAFIHVHSIAYNIYPALRSNEIHLRLPCSTREWNAQTLTQWQAARQDAKKQQLNFQDALSLLLTASDGNADIYPIPSPLGNYILLHGLLQRMHLVRELSLTNLDQSTALPNEELYKIE